MTTCPLARHAPSAGSPLIGARTLWLGFAFPQGTVFRFRMGNNQRGAYHSLSRLDFRLGPTVAPAVRFPDFRSAVQQVGRWW